MFSRFASKINHSKYGKTTSMLRKIHSSSSRSNWNKYLPYLTAITIASVLNSNTENCGIVGVVGSDDSSQYLLEGLTVLRNRGYDSAGMATIGHNGALHVSKYASLNTTSDSIDRLRADNHAHIGSSTGIAHTRWAVCMLLV